MGMWYEYGRRILYRKYSAREAAVMLVLYVTVVVGYTYAILS